MAQTLDIEIKTLTPLWTGGIDGTCDRLHISGLMGSLRYWYEAIVRGAGGYACDPASGGCVYDPDVGVSSICAACYLFGTTGWARLFRMTAMMDKVPDTIEANEPLHFRTFNNMNTRWLQTIYEGIDNDKPTRSSISAQQTIFSQNPLKFHFTWRNYDGEYASKQLQMLFWFLSEYAGIGSKQQFGFGKIEVKSPLLTIDHWNHGLAKYKNRKDEWLFQDPKEHSQPSSQTTHEKAKIPLPNLKCFFFISCTLPGNIIAQRVKIGSTPLLMRNLKNDQIPQYLSSAFDIRYKGDGHLIGFRRYLDGRNPNGLGWNHSELNAFLGTSKWKGEPDIGENERNASRVFINMPYQTDNSENFILHIYGFALPNIEIPGGKLTVEKAIEICKQYLANINGTSEYTKTGAELLLKGADL